MKKLEGKIAVVTGASKGIGAAIAKHLAAEGAAVVVNYASSKEGAERVVDEITKEGGKAIAIQANEDIIHEPGSCLDNPIEPDHRKIKHRYYPMLGFGAFESAKRFCAAFEQVRQYLRIGTQMAEFVSLSMRRTLFVERVQVLEVMFQAA